MHERSDFGIYEANDHELHESPSRLTDSPIVEPEHHRHNETRLKHAQLAPHEHVLLVGSPHWTGILPGLLFLASLFVVPITLSLFGFYGAGAISLVVLVILVPLAFLQLLATRNANTLTVTNQRILCSRGLIDHEHRGVPIGQITNVTAHHDLLQDLIGTGTVKIDIAGALGPEIFPNISHPDELAELIVRLVDDYESDVANEFDQEPPRPHHAAQQHVPSSDVVDEIERLHKLLTSGAISEDEYDDAKAALLKRL